MRKSWEERKRRRIERIISECEVVSKEEINRRWDHLRAIYGDSLLVARDPMSGRTYFFQKWEGGIYPARPSVSKHYEGWEMAAFEMLFLGLY